MKYGPEPNHWNEYILCAYTGHQREVIFLTGIPEIWESLPHASPNPQFGSRASAPQQDSLETELRNSQENDMGPQTVERAIKRCIDISTRLGAIKDEIPAAGRAIVQCMDEIDEMQRWLEGRA